MAKPIYLSNDEIEELLTEAKKQLLTTKCYGSIDIKKNFASDKRKVDIYFTPDAWTKMTALVQEFSTEVQWHGCVERISEFEFEIYDILVPPHVVTGATVTSDIESYSRWMCDLDDETFNHLHFHGHSHVNMSCSPSGTDTKYRQDVITQLPIPQNDDEDSFYIFLIFNKKGEWTGEVYDLKYNALYDTKDISVDVYSDGFGLLSEFIDDAKKQAVRETSKSVVTKTPATKSSYSYSGKTSSYDSKKTKKDEDGQEDIFEHLSRTMRSYYGDDDDDYTSPFYSRGY